LPPPEPAEAAKQRKSLLAQVTVWFVDLFWSGYYATIRKPSF